MQFASPGVLFGASDANRPQKFSGTLDPGSFSRFYEKAKLTNETHAVMAGNEFPMTRGHGRPKQERKINNMKTKLIGRIVLSLGLVFVLSSAVAHLHGGSPATPQEQQLPVITIHSTGDVTRAKTGSFVLNMNPPLMLGGVYVNFSVSGTAVPGVDYVPLISPAYIGQSGYGVILVQTLPDRRASSSRKAYSVVVTLEPGLAYALGEPKSAQMMIKP